MIVLLHAMAVPVDCQVDGAALGFRGITFADPLSHTWRLPLHQSEGVQLSFQLHTTFGVDSQKSAYDTLPSFGILPFVIAAFRAYTIGVPIPESHGADAKASDRPAAPSQPKITPSATPGRHRMDDSDGDGLSFDKRPKKRREPLPLYLACPFWKKDPRAFGDCCRFKMTSINYVKQHLHRRHTQPPVCMRCGTNFETREGLMVHLRDLQICQIRQFSLVGLSDAQRAQLRRRSDPRKNVQEQWYAIWDILFPGEQRPASPFVPDSLSADLASFHEFMVNRGSDLITEELAGSFFALKRSDEADALSQTIQQAMEKIFEEWRDVKSLATEKGGDAERQEKEADRQEGEADRQEGEADRQEGETDRQEGETDREEGETEHPGVDLLERWLAHYEDFRGGEQEQDQPSTQHTRSPTCDKAETEKHDGILPTSTTAPPGDTETRQFSGLIDQADKRRHADQDEDDLDTSGKGDRPAFICKLCDKTFYNPRVLRRHTKTVHSPDGKVLWKCSCGRQAARRDNMIRHLRQCRAGRLEKAGLEVITVPATKVSREPDLGETSTTTPRPGAELAAEHELANDPTALASKTAPIFQSSPP